MPLLEEEGRYIATVTGAELGEAKTGTPFMQLNFETEEGSIAGRLYFSDKAFDRSLNVLKDAFGFDGNFANLDPLKGQECSITTEFEEFETDNGEVRQNLRVKWINPKGGSKLPEGERKSLADRLSALAGKTPAAASEESGDDDTPF